MEDEPVRMTDLEGDSFSIRPSAVTAVNQLSHAMHIVTLDAVDGGTYYVRGDSYEIHCALFLGGKS